VLLQRNLIYTGITRGRKLVVLVGQRKALGIAVRNDRPQRRYSGLLASLRGPPPNHPHWHDVRTERGDADNRDTICRDSACMVLGISRHGMPMTFGKGVRTGSR
jgi:hypothetical protein